MNRRFSIIVWVVVGVLPLLGPAALHAQRSSPPAKAAPARKAPAKATPAKAAKAPAKAAAKKAPAKAGRR